MDEDCQLNDEIKTIDDLKLSIDCHLPKVNLSWDDCLLFTSYDKDQTFVLMADGKHLLIEQSLRECINAFAKFNNCLQSNICPSSVILGQHVRGIVAGLNRLLPSSGVHNPDVVFYMARLLKGYVYLRDEGQVIAHLVNSKVNYRIAIPAYKRTFASILKDADELSDLQLGVLHYLMHCYAYKHECTQLANHYHCNRQMRQQVAKWDETKLLWIVNEAYKTCYGQPVEDEMRSELVSVMERCYQTK